MRGIIRRSKTFNKLRNITLHNIKPILFFKYFFIKILFQFKKKTTLMVTVTWWRDKVSENLR
jgi:hypothetical protein